MQALGYGDHGTLMRSEAVPCMGALMAARSAPARAFGVFVVDVGQVEAAAEQGFDEALRGGLFFGALHVFGDAGVAGEVAVVKFLAEMLSMPNDWQGHIGPCRRSGRS